MNALLDTFRFPDAVQAPYHNAAQAFCRDVLRLAADEAASVLMVRFVAENASLPTLTKAHDRLELLGTVYAFEQSFLVLIAESVEAVEDSQAHIRTILVADTPEDCGIKLDVLTLERAVRVVNRIYNLPYF